MVKENVKINKKEARMIEDGKIVKRTTVLPDKQHFFVFFYQLKKLSRIYLDDFGTFDNAPKIDRKFYEIGKKLIIAKNLVQSTNPLNKLE